MFDDPIVEEIRRARHTHASQFGNDLPAIVADLQRLECESGRSYVNFPPRLRKDQLAAGEESPDSTSTSE